MRMKRLLSGLLILGLGFHHAARGGDRVALVIGNQNYRNAQSLTNPVNDARDVKLALEANGHKVTLGTDLDARGNRVRNPGSPSTDRDAVSPH